LIPSGTKGQKLGYESNIETLFWPPLDGFPSGWLDIIHTFPH
jgi:hypothetical protein